MTFIAVSFLAPIGEELLFRGVVFSYARGALKKKWAILFQAVLFGIYHLNLVLKYLATIPYMQGNIKSLIREDMEKAASK